ncbi:putative glycoside hydrolase family 105 protein [Rosellinia necatrix]|uniref:Putative glycoside hydrolase family 105 protein n=1 Tax=Rosellinia necatrix TaxID=77044 RepID=A0A1W2TBA2_ROSNE|nr:putative glycoside hydrolase family 105 protein [Rosellinia necatrix]
MRSPIYVATLAATLLSVPTAATPVEDTYKTRYSQWMASSIMSRGQGIMTGQGGSSEALQAGFVQKALTALSAHYPSSASTYKDYIRKSALSTTHFLSNATYDALSYPMDRLSNGNALLELSSAKGASSSLRATADALRESIDLNRRNSEGGLWYFVYPYWSYLDGMFSLGPFYTLYSLTASSNSKATAAALKDMLFQFDILWDRTRHASTGLLTHGYDFTRKAVWADPKTGASPYVWGRSLGWYTMALLDTLEILEREKADKKFKAPLLKKFQTLVPGVMEAVDPKTGGWWQVVDQPGRKGNYIESSGTAMFSYALLKGARLGYLPKDLVPKATKMATRAQRYLTDTFVVEEYDGTLGYNGTVAVCSLNSTATYEYYVGQPILYDSVLGSAAYLLASLEVERLK